MSVHQPSAVPSVRDQVSDEEWQVRVDLAALYRLVALEGWDDFLFTHLSARVPGPEHHFLLNPLGMTFDEVTASSLLKVDTEGNKVMDSPYAVNAAGFTIHSAVHMAREDARCVMHLHTDDGVAVSAMEQGLMPITQHAMQCGEIAYHDYEGVALDLDERERIVADLGVHNNIVLRNHGLMCCGRSIPEAWRNLYALEKSCEAQLQAMAMANASGRPLKFVADDVAQATSDKLEARHGKDTVSRDWPTQLRRLEVLEPDYAT